MRKANLDTDQISRSLLQKAVRRGCSTLIGQVVNYLTEIGDTKWLKDRLAVIVFEECWVLGETLKLSRDVNIVEMLTKVCEAVKMKDAAGLGTLGYALSKGDFSVLSDDPISDRNIKIIAEAIKRPNDFWAWVNKECNDDRQFLLVQSAEKGFRKGGWPWDRAFMQAAAYLAISSSIPRVQYIQEVHRNFPFWIAIDKHTPRGKEVLRQSSKLFKIPYHQLGWISFYLESAVTNQSNKSYWWTREIDWRLGKAGISYEQAQDLWGDMSPKISQMLESDALDLSKKFVLDLKSEVSLSQLVLF